MMTPREIYKGTETKWRISSLLSSDIVIIISIVHSVVCFRYITVIHITHLHGKYYYVYIAEVGGGKVEAKKQQLALSRIIAEMRFKPGNPNSYVSFLATWSLTFFSRKTRKEALCPNSIHTTCTNTVALLASNLELICKAPNSLGPGYFMECFL